MRIMLLFLFPALAAAQTGSNAGFRVNAGADRVVLTACRNSIVLSCRVSGSAGQSIVYQWTKISGPGTQQMKGQTTASATISGFRRGEYFFEIAARDNRENTVTDTIMVTGHTPVNYRYDKHSGAVLVTGNINGQQLMGSDTITVSGKFTEISLQGIDGKGCEIVVDARRAEQTSPTAFHQPEWYHLHYVKLLGLHSYNWFGTIKASYYINDFTMESCRFINPPGQYKSEPILQFDNPGYSQMIFSGDKKQTFYNNKIIKSRFEGIRDTGPIVLGSNWGPGTKEVNRSIFLDGEMYLDTIRNITNTNAALNVISGTGFNMKIHDCILDSTEANAGAKRHNHAAEVLWYGSIDFYNNRLSDNYAAALRSITLGWTGLPGYRTSVKMYNNIIRRQLSYSPFEVSRNGAGGRDSAHGFLPVPAYCINNSIDSTVRGSYNGDYYGFVLDVVNTGIDNITHTDSVFCFNNVIADPEYDRPYDSASRKYLVAIVSRAATQIAMGNNRVVRTFNRQIFANSHHLAPVTGSLLIDKATREFNFRKTDINGKEKTGAFFDIGATEYEITTESKKTGPGKK